MNILKRCAVYLVLTGSAISAQAPKAAVTISISGPTAPVKAGERFPISILLTNLSDKKMVFGRDNGGRDVGFGEYQGFISYRATPDSIVQTVPPSLWALHPERHGPMGSQSKWLEPGESFVDIMHLTYYYDMSKPGTYSFRLVRKARREPGLGDLGYDEIPSNAIDIVVVE